MTTKCPNHKCKDGFITTYRPWHRPKVVACSVCGGKKTIKVINFCRPKINIPIIIRKKQKYCY